jgi:hypothetical protein
VGLRYRTSNQDPAADTIQTGVRSMKYVLAATCWCFACLYSAVGAAETVYRLTTVPCQNHVLEGSVDRPDPSVSTTLTLRGVATGLVKSQVEDPVCDGRPLNGQAQRGTWQVPAGCRRISWQIDLDGVGVDDASGQRSVVLASRHSFLISESSPLPRLRQSSAPETLLLPPEMSRTTLPRARPDGTIALPKTSRAPLFLLVGAQPVAVRSSGTVLVRYFIDVPKNLNRVPRIDSVARGLQWLTGLIRLHGGMEFNYVWLGIAASSGSFGSATGGELILVNYLRTGTNRPLLADITRATPFTEAIHQLSGMYGGPKPAWLEESLAMYMGLRALGRASPNDPSSHLLLEHFRAAARGFPMGLLAVQREISRGDVSHYGALFTKGIALWDAVDSKMQALGDGSLSNHLEVIWTAKYDHAGRPPADFGTELGLPAMSWKRLEDAFLGG